MIHLACIHPPPAAELYLLSIPRVGDCAALLGSLDSPDPSFKEAIQEMINSRVPGTIGRQQHHSCAVVLR